MPKAFSGHIAVIQENAVRSWMQLPGEPEILLFGDDEGVAEAASRIGVRHEPRLARNEHGTPRLDDLFDRACELAESDWLCYVNSDVILVGDVGEALRSATARLGPMLFLSGRRWRTRIDEPLEFAPGWQPKLIERAARTGRLDVYGAMDWMLFPRSLYGDILPFALGRTRWDAWLASEARSRGATIVDATDAIVAIHQEHRVRGDEEKEAMRVGAEGLRNRELAAGARGGVGSARWRLTADGIRRALEPSRVRWQFFGLRLNRGPAGIPSRIVLKLIGPSRFHRWFAE